MDVGDGQGSPINWTRYTLANVGSPIVGLFAEDGSPTTVTFQIQTPTNNQNSAPSSLSITPTHYNPLNSLCCDILYGGPVPMILTWTGLVPSATYEYWLFTSSSSSAPDVITVTGSTVDVFTSPSIEPTSQRINGLLGSISSTFDSYARQVVSSPLGTIIISYDSSGTPVPSAAALRFLTIRNGSGFNLFVHST